LGYSGVFVELDTQNDKTGAAGLDAKHINDAIFNVGDYATASDAPDC
jgi:hypothetical protein